MNAGKAVAIILLTLFVFTMPLAVFASNFGGVIYNPDKVQDILVDSAFSDQALPFRIKELVTAQTHSGNWGPGVDPVVLDSALEKIDDQQWVTLFDTIMPENARTEMVKNLVGGIFLWLDNDAAYPEIGLSFGPLFSNLDTHGVEIINWATTAFESPACSAEQAAKYESEKYGDDLLILVSCQPPDDLRDGVTAHAISLLPSAEAAGSPSGEINLTEQIKSSVGEELIATIKNQARRLRLALPLLWVIPVFLFVLAIALTVGTLRDVALWTRWPLMAAGAVGVLLALLIMKPASLLAQVLPASGNISSLAAVLFTSLLDGLLNMVGRAMLWQMIIILALGVVLLVLSMMGKGKKADLKPAEVVHPPTEVETESDLSNSGDDNSIQ
jgi:hypothetical protein